MMQPTYEMFLFPFSFCVSVGQGVRYSPSGQDVSSFLSFDSKPAAVILALYIALKLLYGLHIQFAACLVLV